MNTSIEEVALDQVSQTARSLASWSMKLTEKELTTALIGIEGELPYPAVIAEHAERNNERVGGINFDYFWWKGEHILSISQVLIPEVEAGGVLRPWVQVDRVYEEKHGVADVSAYVIQE